MASEMLKSIDDYETFLERTLKSWSPGQRLALAAAMAERWLPAYEAFAEAEQWGDAASLRRTLEAVWDQVKGRALAARERARHAGQLRDSTPHMDDFDCLRSPGGLRDSSGSAGLLRVEQQHEARRAGGAVRL